MQRKLIITILLLVGMLNSVQVAAQESAPAACVTTEGDGPVEVYTSFFINSFRDFESVTETYVVDFFLNLRWQDPAYRNQAPGPVFEEPCFQPQPTFINGDVERRESAPVAYEVIYSNDEYGIVQWLSRYVVNFNTNLNLRSFPNDSHVLPVIIEDFIMDREEMVFRYERQRTADDGPLTRLEPAESIENMNNVINEEYLGLQEWEISDVRMSIEENPYSFFDNAVFSQFRFMLDVERDPAYYNFNVLFIMLMIVCMCFAIFFISPEDLVSRLELSVTIFLSLVAHNYVVQTTLPHIPYLTALDIQMMASKVVVFLTFGQSVLVYLFATESSWSIFERARPHLAARIDRIARYCFPLIIIGMLLIR